MTTVSPTPVLTAQWLARFRWAVVLGAVLTLLLAWITLEFRFPVAVVGAALAVQVASNVWLQRVARRSAPAPVSTFGAVLLLDTGLLTLLMLATGGPSNPFTISYLVYSTLAAIVVSTRWTWIVTSAAVAGYGALFVPALRAPFDPHAVHLAMQPNLGHQVGMWVAFLAAAVLTATFVTRIREALEAREQALAEARQLAARQERLASLTTLAAGAAHELATPLATIATAAVELEQALRRDRYPEAIADDARLVRQQVERCREILDQMSGRADRAAAQAVEHVQMAEVVTRALQGLEAADQAQLRFDLQAGLPPVRLPLEAAARVVRSLIKNALHASTNGRPVRVTLAEQQRGVRLQVQDEGVGMEPAVLARAGEPFFTTRPAGAGFGLGLFLVRTFADQWGGEFDLVSHPGVGTTVTLDLPTVRT